MKKFFLLFILFISAMAAFAQDDAKTMHETAKTFMRSGDFDNAIVVLTGHCSRIKIILKCRKTW